MTSPEGLRNFEPVLYGGHRHYYPDFVAEDNDGNKYLIETKGFVDEDAENKKDRAIEWCNDVSRLFNESWEYVFVHQLVFEKHHWQSFRELREFIKYGERILGEKVAEEPENYKA